MRLNHMVQLPLEDQMRLTATMQEPQLCGTSGETMYDPTPEGFEEFMSSSLDIFERADIITPEEFTEVSDGYIITGNDLVNAAMTSCECEASQGYNYLIAMPHGLRWFRDETRASGLPDVIDVEPNRPTLPPGLRWPTPEEGHGIARVWHTRLHVDEMARREHFDDTDMATAVMQASLYALNVCVNDESFEMIRNENGLYPPTPLAMLNVLLQQLMPGLIVGVFDGLLTWVIIEKTWSAFRPVQSLLIPESDFDPTPFMEGWYFEEDEDDYAFHDGSGRPDF
jgi:hypothetical protein